MNKFCKISKLSWINENLKHYLFLKAIRIHSALIHGVIAKKSIKIPSNILNWGHIVSIGDSTILTLNIITGILSSITITLPIVKFLSLSRFIEPDIDDNADKIGDPIAKVSSNNSILDSIDLLEYETELAPFVKKYFFLNSGVEHYRLLAHISTYYENETILDIGTFKGGSALALSFNNNNFHFEDILSKITHIAVGLLKEKVHNEN